MLGDYGLIELVGFVNSDREDRVERFTKDRALPYGRATAPLIRQPQTDCRSLARRYCQFVVRRSLCSDLFRVDGLLIAMNDEIVNAVFDEMRTIGRVEKTLRIRIVLGKQKLRRVVTEEPPLA